MHTFCCRDQQIWTLYKGIFSTKAGKRVEEFGSSVTAFFCPSTVPHQNTSRTHSIISSPVQCVSFHFGQRLNFLKFHFCMCSSWATNATLRMNAFEKCFDILQLFCRRLIFDQFCLRTTAELAIKAIQGILAWKPHQSYIKSHYLWRKAYCSKSLFETDKFHQKGEYFFISISHAYRSRDSKTTF